MSSLAPVLYRPSHNLAPCLQAKNAAPAIIFIDEIDAVGRERGGDQGNDERDTTLNMLLTCMDGFERSNNVIVMAATNRIDVLDLALIRPGRFDRIIEIPLPDHIGRSEILQVSCAGGLTLSLDPARIRPRHFQCIIKIPLSLCNVRQNLAAGDLLLGLR